MRFALNVKSNNMAFVDGDEPSDLLLGTLLAKVAMQVDDGVPRGVVKDPVSGQVVGTWTYERGETD